MAILKIKQPNGSWAIVGDTSETIKFTEQQLTNEQKKVARENIGAKAEVEEFIPIENPDVFVFDNATKTWNINPIGSFILTTNSPYWDSGEAEDMLDPDEEWDHACFWQAGDILRGIQIGTTSSGFTKIKQVLSASGPNLEHFRYTQPGGAWDVWNRTAAYPKKEHNQLTHLVGIGSEYVMGGNRTSYQEADPAITYYTDKHYVSYDKETALTDAQKTQARNNIGAISVEIAETPKDGEILVYDATSNKLVNSGYTFESLKTWIQQQINNTILNGEW